MGNTSTMGNTSSDVSSILSTFNADLKLHNCKGCKAQVFNECSACNAANRGGCRLTECGTCNLFGMQPDELRDVIVPQLAELMESDRISESADMFDKVNTLRQSIHRAYNKVRPFIKEAEKAALARAAADEAAASEAVSAAVSAAASATHATKSVVKPCTYDSGYRPIQSMKRQCRECRKEPRESCANPDCANYP